MLASQKWIAVCAVTIALAIPAALHPQSKQPGTSLNLSADEMKRMSFVLDMTETTDKQGWRFVVQNEGSEGRTLVIFGYVSTSNGVLMSGRMKHPVMDGDLFTPSGSRMQEKPDDIARVYYRGSLLNSPSN